MPIPVLDLLRQYESIREELDAKILEVVRSGKYVLGPYVKEFEDAAAAYCGTKHAIGVASGTDALFLALKALDIGPGDAVILPSFTFFATAGVVHNVGATPVFCDIDPKTFNLDPNHLRTILEEAARGKWPVASGRDVRADDSAVDLEGSLTSHKPQARSCCSNHEPRTTNCSCPTNPTNPTNPTHPTHPTNPTPRAIIPVHLYGQVADMNEINAIAQEYGLAVIEDAAQAIGATYSASLNEPNEPYELNEPHAFRAGSLGTLGCFSFYPTKNLGAYGDGGLITSNDDALADKVRLLRVHGAKPKYYHRMVGVNSRLDALQAAILGVKLQYLDAWSAARAQVADRYDEALAGVDGIVTPYRAPDRNHIFHQYTLRVLNGKRDELKQALNDAGIGTMIYYPVPLHLQDCFKHLGYSQGDLPESERASQEALSLPIFPELSEEESSAVVGAIRRSLARSVGS